MKHIRNFFALAATTLLLPLAASAETGEFYDAVTGDGSVGTLLGNIIGFINAVLIPFIIGIGFLFFVWGMFKYFIAGGANDEAKEQGKSLMVYATLGFVLIIIFWGVVNLLAGSTGLTDQSIADGEIGGLPTAPAIGGGGG